MPILLPPGMVVTPTVSSGWHNGRVSRYRFDLLDRDENLLGVLRGVQRGGSIGFDAYASVKSSGSITLTDLGDDIDWLNVRIRPVAILQDIGGGENEYPCGVYLCAAPVAKYTPTGRSWNVELVDKLSILDTDVAGAEGGVPRTFTVPIGSNVIEAVKFVIEDTGEIAPAIEPGDKSLSQSMTWDCGTTRLRIINDLLDAANYFSLYCDGAGQYRTAPYVPPGQRNPVYELEGPFVKGDTSVMSSEWEHDKDIYGIPNRYVVLTQGDGETEAMVAVAINDTESSPYSYQSRGRWITAVETGVEAVSLEDLQGIADRRLSAAKSVTEAFAVSHLFLPDLVMNSVVRFVNPDVGIDTIAAVIDTEIKFDPTALCSSNLREVG